MKTFGFLVAVVLVLGTVRADVDLEDLQNLTASSNLPTLADSRRLLKDRCLLHADEQAWERVQEAPAKARDCVQALFNRTQLEHEIEVAKPTGDLDVVFQKYCRKVPQLVECTSNFTATLSPCLEEAERANANIVVDMVRSLTEFACHRDGDRIALFYAEQGPECLTAHADDIKNCVNTTISSRIQDQEVSLDNLPSLSVNTEQCKSFRELKECVVLKLEQCHEPTPANIVESLFHFIYRKIDCPRHHPYRH